MEPWKRVTTDDSVVEVLQDNAEPLMRKIQDAFLLEGALLKKETITTTASDIPHGLGRAPIGFVVVRRRGNEQVWDLQDDNRNASRTLRLIASGSVEIDLWVF